MNFNPNDGWKDVGGVWESKNPSPAADLDYDGAVSFVIPPPITPFPLIRASCPAPMMTTDDDRARRSAISDEVETIEAKYRDFLVRSAARAKARRPAKKAPAVIEYHVPATIELPEWARELMAAAAAE